MIQEVFGYLGSLRVSSDDQQHSTSQPDLLERVRERVVDHNRKEAMGKALIFITTQYVRECCENRHCTNFPAAKITVDTYIRRFINVHPKEIRGDLLVLADEMWVEKTELDKGSEGYKEIAKYLLCYIAKFAGEDENCSSLTSTKTSAWLTGLVTSGELHAELLQAARDLNFEVLDPL